MKSRYWSLSPFAKWFAKKFGDLERPSSATNEGWNIWHKDAKARSPFVYWVIDVALDRVQDFVRYPYKKLSDAKYYLRNRYIIKSHAAVTTLKRGEYHDMDTLMRHSWFDMLVDFVKVEKATTNVQWSKEARERFDYPGYRRWNFLRWSQWRCAPAGLDHLEWEAALKTDDEWVDKDHPEYGKPTNQAIAAQEILAIYDWWLNIRPNRVDPYDESGWSDYCRDKAVEAMPRAETTPMLDRINELQKQYDDEDEQMMIRLIKIRGHLWT